MIDVEIECNSTFELASSSEQTGRWDWDEEQGKRKNAS